MDDYFKRSGQIPAFGNWDYANELPITQYFESARQAGLLRYTSSSFGEFDLPMATADLYAIDLKKPTPTVVPTRKIRGGEKRGYPHVKEQRSQGKVVFDVTETPRKQRKQQPTSLKQSQMLRDDAVAPTSRPPPPTIRAPKAVDEDLYKIPPELLRSSKRKKKKVLGFLTSCLVPSCAV